MPLFQIQTSRLEGISFMTMTIRPETPSDEAAIEQVTRLSGFMRGTAF